MRLLIVAPKFVHRPGVFYHFPVGLAYVSASLKAAGFDVACLNTNHSSLSSAEQVCQAVRRLAPNVILSGGLSTNYVAVKGIFDVARSISSDILSVAGGGLVSSLPELSLNGLGADYGIIGEGELASVALMETLRDSEDPSAVEGIVYRDERGNACLTAERSAIDRLDTLPFPDLASFDVATYLEWQLPNSTFSTFPNDNPRSLPLVASRSCPFQCSFCYHPLGNRYRQRSLENIFAEIEILQRSYDINGLSIYDELFIQHDNHKRLIDFCEFMKGRGIHWRVSLRVDCVDNDVLAMLKRSGCYYICYGLESASDAVLESMGKKIRVAQIERALELTTHHRIGIQGNFIFGDNREDLRTAGETIAWWESHLDYQLHLTMVETYPGSALYRRAVRDGVIENEAEYLSGGRFLINNTQLNKAEFSHLQASIDTLQQRKLIIPARLLDTQLGECDALGRQL